ncbi:DNA polymerase theta [Harmonia axyridis]|uniref:DNA polymerase theta n=1 Tax=Harmonia axyridis TaxID=115357 RepID=UPI001E27644B|nr:DNA polymerase theta [Harmonia axyridis]
MNDTLDYFAETQIENFVTENLLKTQRNQDIEGSSRELQSSISFDDSLFLQDYNSQVLSAIKYGDNLPIENSNEDNSKQNENDVFRNATLDQKKFEELSSNNTTENNITVDNENQSLKNVFFLTHNINQESKIHNGHYSELELSDPSKKINDNSDNFISPGLNNKAVEEKLINTQFNGNAISQKPFEVPETPLEIFEVEETEHCSKDIIKNDKLTVDIDSRDSQLLSSWGLPESVLKSYRKRKITLMFDWQLECLSKDGIFDKDKNLVYSAPTSAGKTLVAEILAMKCLFERKKKVLFILPFISVVREKVYYFQDLLGSSGKRVEGFMGSYNPPGGFQSVHLAVGTIEKCNSLVNRLMEENKLEDIGLVIIDEMHLIGDPHRGYLLELLLTKLKYVMAKNTNVQIQIVGMSATLPNLDLLANWLNAELYTTNFRPIPLHEMVYVNKELYNNEFKLLRKLSTFPDLVTDTDDILQLCLETIKISSSVLIFCPTKNWCENLAQQTAMAFWRIGKSDSELSKILHENLSIDKISEILEQLKYCPSGLDRILKNTVAFGVAFHHAGLTMEERDIIEGGFRNGGIKLLIATSTLSSGVNLPARRVIIRSPIFNGRPIDILTYRQMIGRAGRMGIDTEGQSILICQKSDYNTAKFLTQSSLKPVSSCLKDVSKFKRAILEIIASGVASSPEDLEVFSKSTLISIQEDETSEKLSPVSQVVEFLKNFNFIRLQKTEDGLNRYMPTALGKACLSSSLPPGEGLELFTELEKARQCFVLETELHLIYLVTPYSSCYQWPRIDWMLYLEFWEKLPLSMKKVGELVGVRESFIINATRGSVQESPKLLIHKRFFIALALQDLVNEKPLDEVATKFTCNRGLLQSLQQSASTFAGMVTSFSRQLGWSSVEILISQFQDRLQFGVSRDLLDLMKLPCLNSKQARTFYDAGIENLIQLANSDVYTIENILHKVMPFENAQEREGENEYDFKERNRLRTIWITGKQGLTERDAANLILNDARKYLEHEMGVKNIKWGTEKDEENSEQETNTLGQTIDEKEEPSINNESAIQMRKHDNPVNQITTNSKPVKDVSNNHKQINIQSILPQINKVHIINDSRPKEPLPKNENICFDSGISLPSETPRSNGSSLNSSSNDDLFEESLEETIEKVSSLSVDSRKRVHKSKMAPISKKVKVDTDQNIPIQSQDSSFDFRDKKDLSSEPIDLSKFFIIDVCKHHKLYQSFCMELRNQKKICLSLACRNIEDGTPKIGLNVEKIARNNYKYIFENRKVDGVAITWDGKHVFYLFMDDNGCEEKFNILKNYLQIKENCVEFFNSKECILMLNKAIGLDVCTKIEDPKVLDWLLEPDGREKDFHSMMNKYCLEAKGLSTLMETCRGHQSLGMNVENSIEPRMRASVEAVVTWNLMAVMKEILAEYPNNVIETFELEMDVILITSKMEISGIGIDISALESLMSSIKSSSKAIEQKIFSIAGRKFSLTSSKEIAKAIGLRTSKRTSTNKQILEESNHPISNLIIIWRKLSCTLSKMLQPLLGMIKNNRVHGRYISHTSTGRISMHEPNIQNVAKDFDFENTISKEIVSISCRSIFIPKKDNIFISADYCQLELRMLTHLSGDELLRNILNKDGDIFKSIAAKWNKISEKQVTEIIRNQTKQICYGIIYGIGSKALSQQLKIGVEEASTFMENFKNTYPGLKKYIQNVIDHCREKGFVETISGRRRNLSLIGDENPAIRSHAERQAVNTTIQGSAADLVKNAMKRIEDSFNDNFESKEKPTLVLHLHDELLFEVNRKYLSKTAHLLKKCMESVSLSVPFPVKLKIGESWGTLREQCDIY